MDLQKVRPEQDDRDDGRKLRSQVFIVTKLPGGGGGGATGTCHVSGYRSHLVFLERVSKE